MLLLASRINLIVFVLFGLTKGAYLIDFNRVYHRNLANVKREGKWCTVSSFKHFFLFYSFIHSSSSQLSVLSFIAATIFPHQLARFPVYLVLQVLHLKHFHFHSETFSCFIWSNASWVRQDASDEITQVLSHIEVVSVPVNLNIINEQTHTHIHSQIKHINDAERWVKPQSSG